MLQNKRRPCRFKSKENKLRLRSESTKKKNYAKNFIIKQFRRKEKKTNQVGLTSGCENKNILKRCKFQQIFP